MRITLYNIFEWFDADCAYIRIMLLANIANLIPSLSLYTLTPEKKLRVIHMFLHYISKAYAYFLSICFSIMIVN